MKQKIASVSLKPVQEIVRAMGYEITFRAYGVRIYAELMYAFIAYSILILLALTALKMIRNMGVSSLSSRVKWRRISLLL